MEVTEAPPRASTLEGHRKTRECVFDQGGRRFWRGYCGHCDRMLMVWPREEYGSKEMPRHSKCDCGWHTTFCVD